MPDDDARHEDNSKDEAPWREIADRPTGRALRAFRDDENRDKRCGTVGLCLSGGGFRAALFHLGALRRLNELGILSRVNFISAVSGGSILAAHLADRIGDRWPQPGEHIEDWDTLVRRGSGGLPNKTIEPARCFAHRGGQWKGCRRTTPPS